jgi:hypothetical protein
MSQKQYISHYENLKDKWVDRHQDLQKILHEKHSEAREWIEKSTQHLLVGSMAGMMLLTTPMAQSITIGTSSAQERPYQDLDKRVFLISDLSYELPDVVQPLSAPEEDLIAQTVTRHFNIRVTPELQGIRLNRSYGYIGAEQHLARYPGDTMNSHFDSTDDSQKYYSSGMAPGLGAWGYFARSQTSMTQQDALREKYYIAVQTFMSPGYNENVRVYNEFFKYRKMLVINPNNGKGIVVVIGDAGPAVWTGKHLGGSPEVMNYLERVDGAQKGPVLYFFVNDPFDNVPLGPISVTE